MLNSEEILTTGDVHAGTVLVPPSNAAGVHRPDASVDVVQFPVEAIVEPPARSTRYLPGAVLAGKYRLDSVLGEGGMGSVWQATNVLLELPVAIKLIRSDLDRGALRGRLQLEARSAAKLGHPAIVRVYDVGESESGDPFIVMELLQGETLAGMLDQERLSATRAVQLLLPIIDALSMAHSRGIVHRDMKPDNVMIALEDQHVQPKILDFGIAKLTDPRDSDYKLTEVGAVVGSPDYMSPEQARGRDDLDASTDIWSICVVLYEAITGDAPFHGTNYNALLRAIVEDEPKSIVEHAAGDEALWQVLRRGLAKERSQRHASMSDLGRELANWLLTHGVHEDACGTSLESKWHGRASDPRSLAPAGTRGSSPDFEARSGRDDNGTGVARGPFTAEIRPHTEGRTLALGAVLAVASLLALSGVVLSRSMRVEPVSAANQAMATALPTVAAAVVRPEPASTPIPARVPSSVVVPIADVPAPRSLVSTKEPARSPQPNAARATTRNPLPAAAARAGEPASSRVASPAPPQPVAKPTERPLDLLSPY